VIVRPRKKTKELDKCHFANRQKNIVIEPEESWEIQLSSGSMTMGGALWGSLVGANY
jgi:hypothetical protein